MCPHLHETTVRSDADLWRWIRDGGGISQDEHRDSLLTGAENRRGFAYLDRRDGAALDEIAQEIAEGMPWFGIRDGEGLWGWLGDYQAQSSARDYGREYAEYMRVVPDEREEETVEWVEQAERFARGMLAAMSAASVV